MALVNFVFNPTQKNRGKNRGGLVQQQFLLRPVNDQNRSPFRRTEDNIQKRAHISRQPSQIIAKVSQG